MRERAQFSGSGKGRGKYDWAYMNVAVRPSQKKRIHRAAKMHGMPVSAFVRGLFEDYEDGGKRIDPKDAKPLKRGRPKNGK